MKITMGEFDHKNIKVNFPAGVVDNNKQRV